MIKYHLLQERLVLGKKINAIVYNNGPEFYLTNDNNEFICYHIENGRQRFHYDSCNLHYIYVGRYNKDIHLAKSSYQGQELTDVRYGLNTKYEFYDYSHSELEPAGMHFDSNEDIPIGNWTKAVKHEVRLFQFLNQWAYAIVLDDLSKINSVEYTKRIMNDLQRTGLKLPYKFMLMSWNGQLESDETGVITDDQLAETWESLFNQMAVLT